MTRARHAAIPMPSLDARARNHATIRLAGYGDKLDALIALLAEQRAMCEEVAVLNSSRGPVVSIFAANALAELARRARGCILAIDHTLDDPHVTGTHSDLGRWGQNGQGPRVADMLRAAWFHAGAK